MACSSPDYYITNKKSYEATIKGNYTDALAALDKNKYLTSKHSRVLYLIEKARLQMLSGQYDAAFTNLETAHRELDGWDLLKERDIMGSIRVTRSTQTAFTTFTSSTVYKPLKEFFKPPQKLPYRPGAHERMLIHYYKAMCKLHLQQYDEALVEARQLDELSHSYDDLRFVEPACKNYTSDAWPQLFSGLIYELANEPNNALIAYHNAWNKLCAPEVPSLFGVQAPLQLRKDLLRLSYRLQFDDKLATYEKQFNTAFVRDTSLATCIVIIDNGFVPVKKNDHASYYVRKGTIVRGRDKAVNSRYLSKPEYIWPAIKPDMVVSVSNQTPEMLYHPAHIALKTLNKRYNAEADYYLSQYMKGDSVESRSKENLVCDTRNWQFIPARIQYLKIPSDTGLQQLYIRRQSGITDTLTMRIRRGNNLIHINR